MLKGEAVDVWFRIAERAETIANLHHTKDELNFEIFNVHVRF